jgi:hypothetical protein
MNVGTGTEAVQFLFRENINSIFGIQCEHGEQGMRCKHGVHSEHGRHSVHCVCTVNKVCTACTVCTVCTTCTVYTVCLPPIGMCGGHVSPDPCIILSATQSRPGPPLPLLPLHPLHPLISPPFHRFPHIAANSRHYETDAEPDPEFVNVQGAQESIHPAYVARARICKRLWSPGGIDSASLCSLAGRYVK